MTAEDDLYLPLAFGLHATPGAYAVLAGAGVSRGAGLKTAWEIELDLVRKVQAVIGDDTVIDDDNAESWYEERFSEPLTYSGLLHRLAPQSAHEREGLLRAYFESAEGNVQEPSKAHRSIARLMHLGVIRVVLTMNFDHLFEEALRELGITPIVVSTDADAAGLPPLHTLDYLVVHLHGDYRDGSSMLNTVEELSGYQPAVAQLLKRVLSDHGLLVAGWSVQHDHALRDAVARHAGRHYTIGWIEPGTPNPAAEKLITSKRAVILATTADVAFGRLADQVIALRQHRMRHPITVGIAARTIKRDLGGDHPAITAHDLVGESFSDLQRTVADVAAAAAADRDNLDRIPEFAAQLSAAAQVPAAAVATLAYWGDPQTDRWWLPELDRYAHKFAMDSGLSYTHLLELPMLVGTQLLYAAGVAAAASERYDVLRAILSRSPLRPGPRLPNEGEVLGARLDWRRRFFPATERGYEPPDTGVLLSSSLGLAADRIDDAWQEFEVLRIAAVIRTADGYEKALGSYASAQRQAVHSSSVFARDGDIDAAYAAEDTRAAEATADASRKLGQIASLAAGITAPHLHVVDTTNAHGDRWTSGAAIRLREKPSDFGGLLPYQQVLGTSGDVRERDVLLEATELTIHRLALRQINSLGSGWMPNRLWLDRDVTTTGCN